MAFIIAEIGINHNGDLDLAHELILKAKECGCDAVKFQKRDIESVYTSEFLDSLRESPWGATQRAQKEGIELRNSEYVVLKRVCDNLGIHFLASAWDLISLEFLNSLGVRYHKIASAMLSNTEFIRSVAKSKKFTFISTGMSTLQEIKDAVEMFEWERCPFELLHCVSTYPMKVEDANLRRIKSLRERFKCNVGYSGHEVGLSVSLAACSLGATTLERHITLDRSMYGSDQSASLEIEGLRKLVKYVREIEQVFGDGKIEPSKCEEASRLKLRGV